MAIFLEVARNLAQFFPTVANKLIGPGFIPSFGDTWTFMDTRNKYKIAHVLFDISLIGKAVDGVLEVVGGVALLLINPDRINWMLRVLTQRELIEDPHDLIAGFLLRSGQGLSADTKVFAAIFLLWHGIVKIGLVWALRRKLIWAYPTAIAAFGLFLGYQIYRYSHTRSVWLLALSILDLFVIILTWFEYKRLHTSQKRHEIASGT